MARKEHFVRPPHAAYVSKRNMPVTMMDRQLAAMRLQQEEASLRIDSEQELARELMDFSNVTETDEYGFPLFTRYQIPDDVPDVYVPPQTGTEKVDEAKKEITPDAPVSPLPE